MICEQCWWVCSCCFSSLRRSYGVHFGGRELQGSTLWFWRLRAGEGIYLFDWTPSSSFACPSSSEGLSISCSRTWTFLLCFVVVLCVLRCLGMIVFLDDTIFFKSQKLIRTHLGIMPGREVPQSTRADWVQLAGIFDRIHGGSNVSQKAAAYLRGLASNTLPTDEVLPLPWHSSDEIQVMPQAREEPHACVLAVLSPSIPLRAVWRRGRWWVCCNRGFSKRVFLEESISINSIFSQRKKLVAPMPPFHFPNRKKCNMQGRLNYLQLSTQQYYFKWSSQVGSRTSVFSFKLLHVGFQEVSLFLKYIQASVAKTNIHVESAKVVEVSAKKLWPLLAKISKCGKKTGSAILFMVVKGIPSNFWSPSTV